MRHRITIAGLTALLLALPPLTALAEPAATPEAATWQHHHVRFLYLGFTSRYTCSGLDGKVANILRFFGARSDIGVHTVGCPRGPSSLTHSAWIAVDFDTLAEAPADAVTGDTVAAQWSARELNPVRPIFMGDGDCELMEALKPILTGNFSWRDLSYKTQCTPHQAYLLDEYHVHGQVLKPATTPAG